ncbi:transposase [Hydrogenophilus thermoluteolus]
MLHCQLFDLSRRNASMTLADELECYLTQVAGVLGHADRHAGLKDYGRGLLLPIARKNIEPIAAYLDPERVQAKHQALHHFVVKAHRATTFSAPCLKPTH